MNRILLKRANRPILIVVFFAFVVRISYIAFGIITKGNSFFINGDSFSYTGQIFNLINHGTYSFDMSNPEAAFGRLPGYPFFFGLNYLLFPDHAYLATAISQAVLDSIVVYFIYGIISRITQNRHWAITGAVIYSMYVFSIVKVPECSSESLGVFFALWYFFIASKQNYHSRQWCLTLGLIAVLAFYTREFLGILLPITLAYFLFLLMRRKIKPANILIYFFAFFSLYCIWPIRNYLSFQRIELIKPRNAGYTTFGKDISEFREWMYAWNTDVQPYLNRILNDEDPGFPDFVFRDSTEKDKVAALAHNCMVCGSSFRAWIHKKTIQPDCNDSIAKEFDALRKGFIERKPSIYYLKIPLYNLGKAFFKNSLTVPLKDTNMNLFLKILFAWRSLLVLAGFAGLYTIRKSFAGYLITVFCVFIYIYIPVYIRQVEMRYLLQADILLLIPAAVGIGMLYQKLLRLRKKN